MFGKYDRLSSKSKGIVQIILGLTVILYIIRILPFWVPLLSAIGLIFHGMVAAGIYEPISKIFSKK